MGLPLLLTWSGLNEFIALGFCLLFSNGDSRPVTQFGSISDWIDS